MKLDIYLGGGSQVFYCLDYGLLVAVFQNYGYFLSFISVSAKSYTPQKFSLYVLNKQKKF